MIRKNIYFIIGHGKCGKSTLVRALTGTYRHSRRLIRQTDGVDIDIDIWPQSCQEGGYDPDETIGHINNSGADNILITLRFEPAPGMSPYNAIEYYNLISTSYNVAQVVFMGVEEKVGNFETTPLANTLNLCQSRPVNANASIVREWWGWV